MSCSARQSRAPASTGCRSRTSRSAGMTGGLLVAKHCSSLRHLVSPHAYGPLQSRAKHSMSVPMCLL